MLGGLRDRLRATSFDAWLFTLMLAFVSLAVGAGLWVSYSALRYVADEIGGMPPAVTAAFPLTIDAAVAAGLLGEWWLAGRRRKAWLAFGYMLAFGLVFAALTVGGNALHGALALSVQRPVELHIGGRLVPLPWWIPIAVSAVPGLAIAGAGTALSLVVGVWRRERVAGGVIPVGEEEALRQQQAEAIPASTAARAQIEAAHSARERAELMLAESVAALREQLAEAESRASAALTAAEAAQAASERTADLLASKTEAAALLELELAEARVDVEAARTAREHAEQLLARRPSSPAANRRNGGRQTAKNGARGHAREQVREQAGTDVSTLVPVAVASSGADVANGAREQAPEVSAVTSTDTLEAPPADPSRGDPRMAQNGAGERAREQGGQDAGSDVSPLVPVAVVSSAEDVGADAREQTPEVSADTSTDRPEPPPDDRPRGGRRPARSGARERARGHAREQTSRVPAGEVKAMVQDAHEQLLASNGSEPDDGDIAEHLTARGHRISASRVRTYLAELRRDGALGSESPARRLRVFTGSAAAPAAAAREA